MSKGERNEDSRIFSRREALTGLGALIVVTTWAVGEVVLAPAVASSIQSPVGQPAAPLKTVEGRSIVIEVINHEKIGERALDPKF